MPRSHQISRSPAFIAFLRAVGLGLLALLGVAEARACAECGGKGKNSFALRELEPKASRLHPDAPVVEYSLDVAETVLAPAGRPSRALSVNGSVPGPILRFRVGDVARIQVRNRLADATTSIHWHGLLVPNLEDGVPDITTPAIQPGASRTYEFLLKHAGTYWYHSHSDLQEQSGVYGAIVVDPPSGAPARTDIPHIDREEVLVLSDWTHETPEEVMRTLLRGSDWYALRKGTAQSVWGAWRSGYLEDFIQREKARLPAMDVSDVAYDAFLINGRPRQTAPAAPGQTVRLRIINAGAASYFYVGSATGPLTVIAADGTDVAPIRQHQLLLGMGETYDVLVTLPDDPADSHTAWEVRATAQDNSGHASLLLGGGGDTSAAIHHAPAPGPLNPYSMDEAMEVILDMADADGGATDEAALTAEPARPLPPYPRLRALAPTTLPAGAPIRELTLRLTGDMERYLWSIDGKTLGEADVIPVRRGEIMRFTLVNDTMMHHPMHLHGHFFRLLMPNGPPSEFAPLKHTVDVPPMSRRVIEFFGDEERDWLFHCHLLYHHGSGMGRVLSYAAAEPTPPSPASPATPPPPPYQANLGEHAMAHPYAWADIIVQNNFSDGRAALQAGRDNLNLDWDAALRHEPDYEIETTYARYIDPRWTAFAGFRLTDREDRRDSPLLGAAYLLPYRVEFTTTLALAEGARFALARDLALTGRLGLITRVSWDTGYDPEWRAGLAWRVSKRLSLVTLYDSEHGYGAGIGFHL